MRKLYLRLIAAVLLICSLCSLLPVSAVGRVGDAQFLTMLDVLQRRYVNGEYWNGYNHNADRETGTAKCSCYRSCKTCGDACGAFYYEGAKIAGQCLGFAYQLGFDMFGNNPQNWSQHRNASALKPGDIVYGDIGPMFGRSLGRTNHAVFITNVTEEYVTFADCNWTGPCKVRWGKSVPRYTVAQCMSAADILTAPNNAIGQLPNLSLSADKLYVAGEKVQINWSSRISGAKMTLYANTASGLRELKSGKPAVSPVSYGKLKKGSYTVKLSLPDEELKVELAVFEAKEMNFTDVKKSHWFYKNNAVRYVYSEGLFEGVGKGEFAPDGSMNRAMFVTVLGRLAGVTVSHKVATKFTDVPTEQWYSGYVSWAANKGIVSGVSETSFQPFAPITREQICKMMVLFCEKYAIPLVGENSTVFADSYAISKWAAQYVTKCAKAGLINGMEEGGKYYFAPQSSATRAQVATILTNLAPKLPFRGREIFEVELIEGEWLPDEEPTEPGEPTEPEETENVF